MPFFMHYTNRDEPQELSESEAHHIIDVDLPNSKVEMWQKLMRGEQVHVRLGHLTWERLVS
jgi:hypothetical protein